MSTTSRRVGYQGVNYELYQILCSEHEALLRAAIHMKLISQTDDLSHEHFVKLADASFIETKHAVISVLTATCFLEGYIYFYATQFIDPDEYNDRINTLEFVDRWIEAPFICQQITIRNNHPAINDLNELTKARNDIVHQKIKWMTIDNPKPPGVGTAARRFMCAAKKSKKTVDSLVALLKTPR